MILPRAMTVYLCTLGPRPEAKGDFSRVVYGQKREALRAGRYSLLQTGFRQRVVWLCEGTRRVRLATIRRDVDGRGVQVTWHRPSAQVRF